MSSIERAAAFYLGRRYDPASRRVLGGDMLGASGRQTGEREAEDEALEPA